MDYGASKLEYCRNAIGKKKVVNGRKKTRVKGG